MLVKKLLDAALSETDDRSAFFRDVAIWLASRGFHDGPPARVERETKPMNAAGIVTQADGPKSSKHYAIPHDDFYDKVVCPDCNHPLRHCQCK